MLTPFSSAVSVDPDNLLPDQSRLKFQQLLQEYDRVFDPQITGYNGAAGPIQVTVNIGPVQPPQRKGRIPQYSSNQLVELQAMFDELEQAKVFRRPEDLGITVEYVNPTFLVKKPSGGYRLVTAFADVSRYSKPQPSLMPDVNSTHRTIAPWRYLIKTDLTQAFYQIPLSQYVSHASRLRLAGFYSGKLHKHQLTWLPCEVEALSIAAAVKYVSPFIIQSSHPTTVLTDS